MFIDCLYSYNKVAVAVASPYLEIYVATAAVAPLLYKTKPTVVSFG